MYYYLYDSFLNDKKYLKVIEKIKRTAIDLGINGKHSRMSFLKSFEEMIADEIKSGISVVVIVGNDFTFTKVIDVIARHNIAVGFIPIGPFNNFAKILGLPPEELACQVLAARKLEKFSLGRINNVYFLSNISLKENISQLNLEIDGSFRIFPQKTCPELTICNFWNDFSKKFPKNLIRIFGRSENLKVLIKKDVNNRKFSFFSGEKQNNHFDSYIPSKSISISGSTQTKVIIDNHKVFKLPLKIEVVPSALKVVVGKDRMIE